MKQPISLCAIFLSLFLFTKLPSDGPLSTDEVMRVHQTAECLYNEAELDQAMSKMAREMSSELKDKNPIVVCVLKGAIYTFGNLLPKLDFPLEVDYAHASRYQKDQGYTLKWYAKPHLDCAGRVVVIVDDIIDEGVTAACLMDYFKEEGASEVYCAVLVDKRRDRAENGLLKADFVGVTIPNKFIIGAGLDYEGYFRNMPGIFVMPESAKF